MELLNNGNNPSVSVSWKKMNVGSYVYVLLTKVLWVFVHHVGQVSFPDVKFLHLLLDELLAELLSPRSRDVLPAGGRAQTYPPVENLEGIIRTVSSTDQGLNQPRALTFSDTITHLEQQYVLRNKHASFNFKIMHLSSAALTLKGVSVFSLINISNFNLFACFLFEKVELIVYLQTNL